MPKECLLLFVQVWNLAKLSATQDNEGSTLQGGNESREADDLACASEANASHGDCSGSAAHKSTNVYTATGLTEFPHFQSFAGHNRPPFLVHLLGDYLVSVSSTETITWRVESPLLNTASEIAPARSIALLPPMQEGSRSADPFPGDLHSLQQQQESQRQTNCEHVKLPQPQQPPTAHPQPLKQPLLNPLQSVQNTVGLKALFCSSNEASLPQLSSVCGPEKSNPSHAPPFCTPFAAAAANVRAAETASSSAAFDETQGTAAAAAQRINFGGPTVPDCPVQEDSYEANSAAVVDNTSNADVVRMQGEKSEAEGEVSTETGHVSDVKVFLGVVGTSTPLEASIHAGQQLPVSQRPHESNAHWVPRAGGAAARHVIGTAVASCRSSCLWRPLKGGEPLDAKVQGGYSVSSLNPEQFKVKLVPINCPSNRNRRFPFSVRC